MTQSYVCLKPVPLELQDVEPGILSSFNPVAGLVIVSGGFGSGRTTLMAGFTLAKLEDDHRTHNIIEADAPVEFSFDRVQGSHSMIRQHDIPGDLSSYDAFIKNCLRRGATDIVVGECRQSEDMEAAVVAASSGQTVTLCMAAGSVAATVRRIANLCLQPGSDITPGMVAGSLRLIVNQRLVPGADGGRVALREFLVFDDSLRLQLGEVEPAGWFDLVELAVARHGQSYSTAIRKALDQGAITAETAARELAALG